jgi:hypothetical protein
VRIPLAGGAVAVYSKTKPTNVYLAFPGVPEQIEVFDPAASVARRLVAQAKVKAVS